MNMQRHGRLLLLLLALTGILITLAPPQAALAHPLDVYLQASYVTVGLDQIEVELDITPGVLVAPEVLSELDPDGDQRITDSEAQAYVARITDSLILQLDGQPLSLEVTSIEMPAYLNIQAGYGLIRFVTVAVLSDGLTGTHSITYTNNFAPTGTAYQVNAFVDAGTDITLGVQYRDETQQNIAVDYVIGDITTTAGDSPTTTATTEAFDASTSAGTTGNARRILTYLYDPSLSPWRLLLSLGLALLLGGLHALTPGHGKTLVAAYLVGSRGTVRHAIALGGIVTFTHTASVILIGLLALFASQFIVPNVLVPTLEVLSGALVVIIGARLVWQRWSAFRRRDAAHTHQHPAGHHNHPGHAHNQLLVHDHGDGRLHSHLPPVGDMRPGSLVAMGVSGGLVPCPEALGIMIIAIGINRILLGLGLIVSFSFGLAAVLIAIGILLVRARRLVERFSIIGSRWSGILPLGSAVVVMVLGIGMAFRGLATYLG